MTKRKIAAKYVLLAATLMLAACKEDLYTGLSEQEANEMISILFRAGIPAQRVNDNSGAAVVRVDQRHFHDAVERLKEQGYPKQNFKTLGDVFEGNGFVVSQMEERARFIYAMSEELSRTIAEIDGVLSARTHVVLPNSDPMSRNVTPSSASVVIRHLEDSRTEALLPQIKMLVANSIQGLTYDNVSVVFIPVMQPVSAPVPPEPARQVSSLLLGAGAANWILGSMFGLILVLGGMIVRLRSAAQRRVEGEIDIAPAE